MGMASILDMVSSFALIAACIAVIALCVYAIGWIRKHDKISSQPVVVEKRESLAQVLRGLREESGMTQELVAQSLGVTRQSVSKWESGISDPSTSNLLALAELYGVSAPEILRRVV